MSEDKQYIVSARKYRPATFRTVVGQKTLTDTLLSAIQTNRVAQAYLFCGPRGVGKTTCARIFARNINCLHPNADGEACGECDSCRAIDEGNSFNIMELDAASNNSVDDIRSLTEQVNIRPVNGKYRVFIIDEVHMLSSQAFNAFLKTLEEPPSYVIFILATTEKHKVLPTILSRCQIYDFKRITINDIVEQLAYVASSEGITAEPSALNVIARKADGGMRDALSIFDQVAASSRGNITYQSAIDNLNVLDYEYYFRLVEAFRQGDVQESLLIYKDIRDKGFDSRQFVNGLASHIRNLMVGFDPRSVKLLEVGSDTEQRYVDQARSLPIQWYYEGMKILNDCDLSYLQATNRQLHVELALIRLCQLLHPSEIKPVDKPALKPLQPQQPQQQQPTPQPQQPQQRPEPAVQAPSAPKAAPTQAPPLKPRNAAAPRLQPRVAKAPAATPTDAPAPEKTEPEPAPPAAPQPSESLSAAWNEFVAQHPTKQLLITAMRDYAPTLADGNRLTVTVDNIGIKQIFDDHIDLLLPFLREKVGNPELVMEVSVTQSDAPREKALSEREWLVKIINEVPGVKELLEYTKAELKY